MDPLDFPDIARWESWLADQQGQTEVWLRIAKRHSGIGSVTPSAAIDVALCFGWIDGQRKGLDEVSFLQRFSPRRARSAGRDRRTGLGIPVGGLLGGLAIDVVGLRPALLVAAGGYLIMTLTPLVSAVARPGPPVVRNTLPGLATDATMRT